MSSFLKNAKNGFSVLELIIALALLTLCLASVVIIVFGTQFAALDADPRLGALSHATLEAKNIQAEAVTHFEEVVSTSTRLSDGYRQELFVRNLDNYTKEVTITVSWTGSGSEVHKVSLVIQVIDWSQLGEGNYCSFPATADHWKRPTVLSYFFTSLGNKATDIDVRNTVAYLSANSSSIHASDFYTIDISTPTAPVLLGQLDTGPGISSVVVHGAYAYAANQSLSGQLQVIDISDPTSLKLIATSSLPGIVGVGSSGIGQSIFYGDGKVYIGTTKATGPEFHIFDVSNPRIPKWQGSFEVGSAVNAIAVRNGIAYLATPESQEMILLDVADPSHPTEISRFDAALGSGNGKSIVTEGDTVFLGRTVGGKEMYVLDTASGTPQTLGTIDLNTSVNDFRIMSGLAFFATIDSNKEFQIWNIADLSHSTLLASLNLSSKATSIDCSRYYLYLTTDGADSMVIIGPS